MNSKIGYFVITLLVTLCFQGCKSPESIEGKNNSESSLVIGKDKQDAINTFGQPQKTEVDNKEIEH